MEYTQRRLVGNSSVDNRSTTRARVVGVLAGLVALPIVAVLWYVGLLAIYLFAGGSFGGYGAAAESGDAWWQWPANVLLTLFAIWLVFDVGRSFYRRSLARSRHHR